MLVGERGGIGRLHDFFLFQEWQSVCVLACVTHLRESSYGVRLYFLGGSAAQYPLFGFISSFPFIDLSFLLLSNFSKSYVGTYALVV